MPRDTREPAASSLFLVNAIVGSILAVGLLFIAWYLLGQSGEPLQPEQTQESRHPVARGYNQYLPTELIPVPSRADEDAKPCCVDELYGGAVKNQGPVSCPHSGA